MPGVPLHAPFRLRLEAFSRELKGVEEGRIEALHRARVACRRLRELLPLLELDRDRIRTASRRLRKVTSKLGVVRELDVLMLLIQELGEKSQLAPAALELLAAALTPERAGARARLSAKLPMAKLKRLSRTLERLSQRVASGKTSAGGDGPTGDGRAWQGALEARLARRAAGVQAAIDAAGAVYVPERLHRVRIAVKKLRYAAELAAETAHKPFAADLALLTAVQRLLGRLHDLEVLLRRAREAQASLSPPDLVAWRDLGVLVRGIEHDCRKLHARYMRDRTELTAIATRMAAPTRETLRVVSRSAV